MEVFGGIEAGGTKFVCGFGTCPADLTVESFPTLSPDLTIQKALNFFKERAGSGLKAIGIGSFGPLDLDPTSETYGYVTSTPKLAWQNYNLAGAVATGLNLPVGLDTDVNTAALAEGEWGAARDIEDFIYITVGTGIGGGAVVGGRLVHGLMHPEMGHIPLPHDFQKDPFSGDCAFHRDCLEGLASGSAIRHRWGQFAQDLPLEHPAWPLESHYLSLALSTWVYTLSPRRIIMGGGVMRQAQLFPMIQAELKDLLNQYIPKRALNQEIQNYVVSPQLGTNAGVLGAILLARQCIEAAYLLQH